MYWWNASPNFGDAMAPRIAAFVTRQRIEWAPLEQAQLTGLGSILGPALTEARRRQAQGGEPLMVWGSGLLSPRHVPQEQQGRLTLLALRGPLSATCLDRESTLTGDPGLIVRHMHGDALATPKKYRGGLILHHRQSLAPASRAALEGNGWTVIATATGDDQSVIAQIAACEIILSSSLHELVVADALCVPNQWVDAGRIHATAHFKFHDYANAIGRVLGPPVRLANLNLKRVAAEVQAMDRGYWHRIDAIARQLSASLG
jgi:hypothetical protein